MEGEKKEGTLDLADLKKMMIGKAVVKVQNDRNFSQVI